jgi:cobalt-zinc-cadmium resistance protein CzcA
MVANQLRSVNLPENVEAEIQPPSGPTGEIYRYTLQSKTKTIRELKEIQDWVIDKRLKAVPGIADVISFGGEVKTYEVTLDPNKLNEYNLVVNDVYKAIKDNNANVGGDVLEKDIEHFKGILRTRYIESIILLHECSDNIKKLEKEHYELVDKIEIDKKKLKNN